MNLCKSPLLFLGCNCQHRTATVENGATAKDRLAVRLQEGQQGESFLNINQSPQSEILASL